MCFLLSVFASGVAACSLVFIWCFCFVLVFVFVAHVLCSVLWNVFGVFWVTYDLSVTEVPTVVW